MLSSVRQSIDQFPGAKMRISARNDRWCNLTAFWQSHKKRLIFSLQMSTEVRDFPAPRQVSGIKSVRQSTAFRYMTTSGHKRALIRHEKPAGPWSRKGQLQLPAINRHSLVTVNPTLAEILVGDFRPTSLFRLDT